MNELLQDKRSYWKSESERHKVGLKDEFGLIKEDAAFVLQLSVIAGLLTYVINKIASSQPEDRKMLRMRRLNYFQKSINKSVTLLVLDIIRRLLKRVIEKL